MGKNPSNEEIREGAKEFQEEKGETTDSDKEFTAAEHQAANDYQDAGEPFGSLSNRDRSTKEDVPDREEESESSGDK